MSSSSVCVSCSTHFTWFKRKNRCPSCKQVHCTHCFRKGESLPRRNTKQCLSCHVLSSEPYVRSELMLLSVKQLKAFLVQRNVSSTGCTEKSDLVDVIMNGQASMSTDDTSNETSNEEENFSEQQFSPGTSSRQAQSNAQGMNDFLSGLHLNPTIHNFVQHIFENGPLHSNSSQQNMRHFSHHHERNSPQPSSVRQTPIPVQSKLSLESFKDEQDIKKISSKELKMLLDDNFVDYKGCIEKDELVQRVVMLWQAQKQQNDGIKENAQEREACKVCMDRMIDCVFLECAHLVTCVECGRRLQECPMCRQNIVRIVRVFKS